MSGQQNHAKISPVESTSLPGFSIDANCCRNPACDNFGIPERDIPFTRYGYTYTENNGRLKFKCKRCNQGREAYSNLSVLEAFQRCLRNSIPFASCPNSDCKNHNVNIFEHYHGDLRDKNQKLYRINVEDDSKQYYQARCRSCNKTFPLVKPLRLHTSKRRTWQKDIETFINAVVDGSGPSNVMNQMRVHADLYYSQLRAASNALLSYNNFHIINLMKGKGVYTSEPMRIYTDCIVCSIKTHRKDQRYQMMKIIVSSCRYKNRSLILAFHPLFDQQDFDDITLINDNKQPLSKRRFDYLKHPFNRKEKDPLPLLNVGGYLMEEFYAYLGHFLVLRKLLTQVPNLHFYMDGEANLYNAALNVFSDRIKSDNCDIVVRKMEKDSKSRVPEALNKIYNRLKNKAIRDYKQANTDTKSPAIPELRQFLLNEEMKRVNQTIKENSVDKNDALFPEPLSKIYSKAINRAGSSGNVYWVTNKLPVDKYNSEFRMLWLTRTTERSNTDYELNLYLNGVIFYIDNVFNSFRNRSSMADRPRVTATGHKSYNRNPELPPNLIGDFTINVAFWNFFLKFRSNQKETIAYVHGLVSKPEPPNIKVVFQSRYTFTNAKRMSKWLGI